MKVYKEKQFIVFDFEDGNTCKYDLAQKKMIGKRGGNVKSLNNQLSGLSANELINSCTDRNYADFLYFVKGVIEMHGCTIKNVGTILKHVSEYGLFEQFFSAGLKHIRTDFGYYISEVPAGLIKLCKNFDITLDNDLVRFYKSNPDAYNTAYSLQYESLTWQDVLYFTTAYICDNSTNWKRKSIFTVLIDNYGYNAKSLMLYVDRLKTFEAIDRMSNLARELRDYASMMQRIGGRFDRYPRHWLTTHMIASRNYNRLRQTFDENAFAERIDQGMQWKYGDYIFIYPKSTQEIKDEAVAQNNCVASYIKRVIDGDCHIMFMRYKNAPDESLVTLEIKNNRIVQAKRHYNYDVTQAQSEAIEAWNRWNKRRVEAA